jgi:hypothetical protein
MAVLTVSSGGVPVGSYKAVFAGVETQPANLEKNFAAGLRWNWRIEGGEHNGATASRITSASPSPRNACGKMLAAVIGRALVEKEQIDPATFVGRTYMIVVGQSQSGNGTRVEAAIAV